MAQTLDEQVTVVERALGECMIDTALVVVRAWLNEIGENNPYEEAFVSLQKRYRDLFAKWLNVDDPSAEEELNKLTGDAYQLVDAVYAAIRLKRGLSPEMHGFNADSIPSVMQYFESCVRFRPEDLEWFHDILNDEEHLSVALVAVTALGRNLRTCFSIDAFMALIDGMNAENELVADQCTSYVVMLLVQYDVRIDFFPQLQDAFVNAVAEQDGGDHVFEVICALIESSEKQWMEMYSMGMMTRAMLPKELQKLVEVLGLQEDVQHICDWIADANNRYLNELVPLIPQTWLHAVLIEGNSARERLLTYYGTKAGYRDYLWLHPDVAEEVYVEKLRDGADKPMDYINYAHCLLLRGDRMMAYENYKQARRLCASSKEFFSLFRPDRRALIDHGIPMEHVYMLEDELVNN